MFAMRSPRRRGWLAVACLACTVSAGYLQAQEAPPVEREIVNDPLPAITQPDTTLLADGEQRFLATALLRIRDNQPRIMADAPVVGNLDRFLNTQINILRSPIVLDRVIADPNVASLDEVKIQQRPLDYLAQHLQVHSIENSELFQISFTGKTPESAAAIANAVLDSYVKIQGDMEAHQSQQIIDLLDKEMDRRTRELERLRQSVRALTKMIKTGETQGPAGDRRPDADAIQQMWLQAWREEVELSARLKALEETTTETPGAPATDIELAVADDPAVRGLAHELDKAQQELKDLAQLKPERAARFEGPIKEKIAKLQSELTLKAELARQWHLGQRARAGESQLQSELAQVRLELATKRNMIERLSGLLHEQLAAREKNANHTLDFEFLRRDLERSEAIFKTIADRAEILKTEMRAPERVGEMRRARADEVKVVVSRVGN